MGPVVGTASTGGGQFVDVHASPADLAAWDPVTGAWVIVTMQVGYAPSQTRRLLPRLAPVNAGDKVAFPTPEANALVAAGYAVAAGGTATQAGDGVN
jgi:hypothetical protein